MSIALIAVVVAVNIKGSTLVARTQTAIISLEIVILVVFIVAGLLRTHAAPLPAMGGGSVLGMLSAAGLLYVTYEGFGVVTNAAGAMSNPRRQLPRAMFLALAVVMAIYIVSSLVIVATIGASGAEANQGHALAAAGRAVLGSVGFTAIGVAALVATASAVNSTMFGDDNLGVRISRLDEIPRASAP